MHGNELHAMRTLPAKQSLIAKRGARFWESYEPKTNADCNGGAEPDHYLGPNANAGRFRHPGAHGCPVANGWKLVTFSLDAEGFSGSTRAAMKTATVSEACGSRPCSAQNAS